MERVLGWWRARPRALLVVVALVLSACEASGLSYVRSGEVLGSEARMFIKVPEGWELFDEEEFLDLQSRKLTDEQIQALSDRQWLVIFDAAPDPAIDHLAPDARHPAGFAQIRRLDESESDYTLESLRSEVFPYDSLRFEDGFELIDQTELKNLPGDLEGFEISYTFDLEGTPVGVAQVGALDPSNRIVYLTVVACRQSCFEQERTAIEQLVSSWAVEGSR